MRERCYITYSPIVLRSAGPEICLAMGSCNLGVVAWVLLGVLEWGGLAGSVGMRVSLPGWSHGWERYGLGFNLWV